MFGVVAGLPTTQRQEPSPGRRPVLLERLCDVRHSGGRSGLVLFLEILALAVEGVAPSRFIDSNFVVVWESAHFRLRSCGFREKPLGQVVIASRADSGPLHRVSSGNAYLPDMILPSYMLPRRVFVPFHQVWWDEKRMMGNDDASSYDGAKGVADR